MSEVDRLELEACREASRHALWSLEHCRDLLRSRGEPVTVDLAACAEGR